MVKASMSEILIPNVLVVDDSRTERFWEEKVLRGMGCHVEEAADGTEALRFLMQGGKIDLILLDLSMPRMDGHEFLKEMRKNRELDHIKVMVLSGREEAEVKTVLETGAIDYWLKGSGTMVPKNKVKNLLHTIELEKKLQAVRDIII